MKSIVFIAPFFGKYPNHFNMWLKTCEYNASINWLIYTDDHGDYKYPKNVIVNYCSYAEFIGKIESRLGFSIYDASPYKLCDVKPLYGFVFEENIKEFDYWGFCDSTDTFYGDLRSFLTDEVLESADKFMFLGHMTIFKNTVEVNKRFWQSEELGLPIKKILQSPENHQYDEFNEAGINQIYWKMGYPMRRMDEMIYDISSMRYSFQRSSYDDNYVHFYSRHVPMIFQWKNGKLFALLIEDGSLKRKEIGYVHFQKRYIKCDVFGDVDEFFLVPNAIVDGKTISKEIENERDLIKYIRNVSKDKLFYYPWFKGKYKAGLYHIKKILGKYNL